MKMKLVGRLMVFDGKAWVEQPAEFIVDSEIDLGQEDHDRMLARNAERTIRGDELAEKFTGVTRDRYNFQSKELKAAIEFILDTELPML